MCGRFSEKYTWQELHALYGLTVGFRESEWKPKFNIAPTTDIPVVRYMDGQRRIDLLRWGLIPSWSKEVNNKYPTFNARSDTCTDKPSYRGAWKTSRRCIIPASSFFEWRKADKQPHAISLGNKGPMAFASLWETWKPKDAEPISSVTMITTDGNDLMKPIHDRMPVILGDEDWAAWLGEEAATEEQLRAMMRPFPHERMTAWEVSKEVGKVQNQGEHLAEKT